MVRLNLVVVIESIAIFNIIDNTVKIKTLLFVVLVSSC